ncbi:hypothetical protein, partial [Phytoactinopolyspora endophytica]|uniref:hypothetical protein n=1 Tax=Phytoactinopolyspora endophytica TaxID=1642495 RepID=UPI0013EB1217
SDVEEDWNTMVEGMEVYADIDMNDMEAVAELQEDEETVELMTNMDSASTNIEASVQEECDIDLQDDGS